jgi:uncharacterized Fe-S cluster-containing radical SAM superfamily protein
MTNLCIVPFVHSHVAATYDRKLCCIATPIEGMNKTTNEEYWNSDYVKQVRLDMMAGKLVSDCSVCHKTEQHGVESMRQRLNPLFPMEEIISKMQPDGSMDIPPSYFDIRTLTCNLQCVTCDANNSSRHIRIEREMFPDNGFHVVDIEYERNIIKDVIEGLRNKTVRQIYWCGGEPMLMSAHWDVVEEMERLYEDPTYTDYIANIRIFYNTNMTRLYWKKRLIPEILSKFNVLIWASIDGVEETFEYCRDGANWEQVKNNWQTYRQYIDFTHVSATLSAPVLMDIERFLNFFSGKNLTYNYSHPYEQNVYKNFMDIRLYPQQLFDDIIDNARRKIESSELWGNDYTLTILEMYKQQKKEFADVDYAHIKSEIQRRDKFLKNSHSFEALLSKIHKPAYEWYVSI